MAAAIWSRTCWNGGADDPGSSLTIFTPRLSQQTVIPAIGSIVQADHYRVG